MIEYKNLIISVQYVINFSNSSGGGGNFIISSSCLGFSDVFGGCFGILILKLIS